MATPSITQSEFLAICNGMSHGKASQVQDSTVTMNRAVRYVVSDIDLRSLKRSSQLSPNLFLEQYNYAAPTDLKGEKIIDIRKQVNRPSSEKWSLVDDADFDRTKSSLAYKVAIRDENFSKILRIDGVSGTTKKVIHTCDSITANGTWAASGDASNLMVDTGDFVEGTGSLNFDMAAGGATGVLELTGATAVDLSDYDEQGSFFLWVFIPDYADAQGDTVTNFILRWGNDSSNYWSQTVTTNNDGATFKDGWNLIRWDWSLATETGTVDPNTIDYVRFTVTKSTSLAADTDWRIDDLVFKKGDVYETVYYGKYGWTTSAGAYIEESTTTTDLLVADTDEIELFGYKVAEFAAQELKEYEDVRIFKTEYENTKRKYEGNNPSEALKKTRKVGPLPRIYRIGRL